MGMRMIRVCVCIFEWGLRIVDWFSRDWTGCAVTFGYTLGVDIGRRKIRIESSVREWL